MNICIVDDEKSCIDNLTSCLTKYGSKSGLSINLSTYNNGDSFKNDYEPEKFDIVFLDIYIGDETGMELASYIREHSENGMIIFCTTSLSDMPEAFRYHAFEYIIKPAEYDRVSKIMDDARKVLPTLERYIDLQSGKGLLHFALSSLISVTSSGHYLEISTTEDEPQKIRMTLSDFKDIIGADERFITVNKGILVNMDHITSIADKTCIMQNGSSFPIKTREKGAIKSHWQEYRFAKIRRGQKK